MENDAPVTLGQLSGKPYQPAKKWDDLIDPEKIERLRTVIKDLQRLCTRSSIEIQSLRRKLKLHEHRDGKVVVMKEVTEYDDEMYGVMGNASVTTPEFI